MLSQMLLLANLSIQMMAWGNRNFTRLRFVLVL
ncbi:MAG: hypothetical protein ACI9HK_005995, partial [Pirellulaceae bacterium]